MEVTTTGHFICLVPRQGGRDTSDAKVGPREDGDFKRTDGGSGPPWPIAGAFKGYDCGRYYSGDRIVNRAPRMEQDNDDGPQGRAQRYQLQTECRGQTGEGANDEA